MLEYKLITCHSSIPEQAEFINQFASRHWRVHTMLQTHGGGILYLLERSVGVDEDA